MNVQITENMEFIGISIDTNLQFSIPLLLT